jgi:hypothetical protein
VLFHLVPLPYVILGNANLTYAFGQSMAFMALAAATVWRLRLRDVAQFAGLLMLATVAFLSHVGVFPILLATLIAVAAVYRLLGGTGLRAPARVVLLAAALAAIVSVVSYYGRFGEVYGSLERVWSRAPAAVDSAEPPPGQPGIPATSRTAGQALPGRAAHGLALGVRDLGWPIVVFAIVGLWRVRLRGGSDRLSLVLLAGGVAYLAFLAFAVWAPVEPRFQRYTDEFISRVNYATIPAAVILAARGAASAWQGALPVRAGAAALLAVAVVTGARQWIAWLR